MKRALQILFFVVTMVCYASVFISPEHFWFAGFMSLSIPIIILAHLFLLALSIRRLGSGFWFHLSAIVIGLAFIKASYSMSSNDGDGILKVMSYNVRVFNNYSHLKNEDYISSKKMIGWSVENDADIKCFQEYYSNNNSDIFNVNKKLTRAGWKYNHRHIVARDRMKAEFGIAIYSKFPIISTGVIQSASGEFLNSIFADIVKNKDTVRVYNTHLESMSINEENVVNTDRLAQSYKDTGHRLRHGFISRATQVRELAASIKSCKHSIILCGDLNELPYSYPYFSLRGLLNNAFEKAGHGFGFTFNGKLFFLRIDNQFFSDQIEIHSFKVNRDVNYSDHFPLTATYSW